jgi:hypothetical protein
MGADRLQLEPGERASYFAPTAICAFLAALCAALVVTSMFLVWMPGAEAVTAVGVLGALAAGGLGLALYRAQQRDRRFVVVAADRGGSASFEAVRSAALGAGWQIVAEEPPRRLDARTPGSMLLAGERVAVRFGAGEVRVASICDPGAGFSLPGRRRCAQHRELVRQAVAGRAPS